MWPASGHWPNAGIVRIGDNVAMTTDNTPTLLALTGIYEPSAIQQLADGRFLVVEDEKENPFSLITIGLDGTVSSAPLSAGPLVPADDFRKLQDLEGLAVGLSGTLYAITSHSRDREGDEKKSRNKLVRFRIEGDRLVALTVIGGLKPALVSAHPLLAAAADVRDVKTGGGLNIEALEISPDQQRLLVGFRSPLLDRQAVIAAIENPAAMFDAGEAPRIAPALTTLDLGGNGIRGMSWIPALDGYLVIGGPVASGPVQFQLWFWSGRPDARARRVGVAGVPGFERAEGISPAVIDGRQRIIVVSDDGSREAGRYARFMMFDPALLKIED